MCMNGYFSFTLTEDEKYHIREEGSERYPHRSVPVFTARKSESYKKLAQ